MKKIADKLINEHKNKYDYDCIEKIQEGMIQLLPYII